MTRRAALYLRVSTREQSTAMQRAELEAVAQRAGWTIVETYEDQGISGGKGRDQRPAFDRMLKDAVRRKFDVLMAWSVDRLGRSLQDLINGLSDLQGANVDLYLREQAVDTTTPGGKALFQMLGVFAEFERSIIRQRVQSGVDQARARGKRLGRPRVGETKNDKQRGRPGVNEVLAELTKGSSLRVTARTCGVSLKTVQRIKAAAA
jgi:DNA invertase Pin-like site-specific DNA recombinase